MKSPKIRFKEFQNEWNSRILGDIFKERTERSAVGELLSVSILKGVTKFNELNRWDKSSQDKSNYKVVKKGDIAYNSMRMWQGASGLSKYDGIVSPAYTILEPCENTNSLFFSYMFKKDEMLYKFRIKSQGLTSDTWNLKYTNLKSIEVRIPNDIKEQEKIGEFFRKIDGILDLENSRFKKLENFKKTMLDKLFVKDGADEPQIRLGSFKGEWNSRILGDIADIYQPQTIQAVDFTKNGFDVYGANGIIGKYHSYNHENSQIAVACRGNTCGVVNFTKPKSWITGNAMVINIDNSQEINKYFLYQLLANTDFSYLISGSGQPQITGTIKNHKTRIPSDIKEQEAIGEFFRKIDGILEFSQKKITKLENIKKYLLNKMFV